MILALIAWLLRDQKLIEVTIAIMMVICSVGYITILESPLWLLAKGRVEEAQRVMHSIARVNGRLSQPTTTKETGPTLRVTVAAEQDGKTNCPLVSSENFNNVKVRAVANLQYD